MIAHQFITIFLLATGGLLTISLAEDATENTEQSTAAQTTVEKHNNIHDWTYSSQSDWSQKFPQCADASERQSPINIVTSDLSFESSLKADLSAYSEANKLDFIAKNSHHSVSLKPDESNGTPAPQVSFEASDVPKSDYTLKDIHFHWGESNTMSKGTEHQIDGQQFDAEMHMVHFSNSVQDPKQVFDGTNKNSVLVIGVFIKQVETRNDYFDDILRAVQQVSGCDETYKISGANLASLLPKSLNNFYYYKGSLTTPPCVEVVDWIVVAEPIELSREQIDVLADFEVPDEAAKHRLGANTRQVRPLFNRKVHASFKQSPSDNSGTANNKLWPIKMIVNTIKSAGSIIEGALSSVTTNFIFKQEKTTNDT